MELAPFRTQYAVWGTPVKGFVARVSSIFHTQLVVLLAQRGSCRELPQEEVRPHQPAPPQEEAEATWRVNLCLADTKVSAVFLERSDQRNLLEYLQCTI